MTTTKQRWYQGLWICVPLAWMVLSISRGVLFWKERTGFDIEVDYLAGSPVDRAVLTVLIALGVLILLSRRQNAFAALSSRYLVFALYSLMLFSVAWSRFPVVSAKRFVRAAGTLVMVCCVVTDNDPDARARQLLEWFFILILGASLGFIAFLPHLGRQFDYLGVQWWVGIMATKNNLGQVSSLATVYFVWSMLTRSGGRGFAGDAVALSGSLLLLFGSRSATALAMSAIGVVIVLLVRRWSIAGPRRLFAYACVGSLAVLLVMTMIRLIAGESVLAVVVRLLGRDLTFTGRTDLWQDLSRYLRSRRLLGYGFGGFWVGDLGNDLWDTYLWRPNQAHNGYIDVMLQVGVLGLVLVAYLIAKSYKSTIEILSYRKASGILGLVMITSIVINNFFESTLLRMNHLLWFVFLLFAMMPSGPSQRVSPRSEVTAPPFDR